MEKLFADNTHGRYVGVLSAGLKNSVVKPDNIRGDLPKDMAPCITVEGVVHLSSPDPLASAVQQVLHLACGLHECVGHGDKDRGWDALKFLSTLGARHKTEHVAHNILEDIPTDYRAFSSLPMFKVQLLQAQKYLLGQVLRNNLFRSEPNNKDTEVTIGLTLMAIKCDKYFGSGVVIDEALSQGVIHKFYGDLIDRAATGGWLDRIVGDDVLKSTSAEQVYDFTKEIMDKFFEWKPDTEGGGGGGTGTGSTDDDDGEGEGGEKTSEESEGKEETDVSDGDESEGEGEDSDAVDERDTEEEEELEKFIEDNIDDHDKKLLTEGEVEEAKYNYRYYKSNDEYVSQPEEEMRLMDFT
mgnify:CR=1 FL=1